MERLDLSRLSVRELNQYLHHELPKNGVDELEIVNPNGLHNIAVGLTVPVRIRVLGHAGYYLAGMNQQADVTVQGNVGWSVAENMMSGTVRIKGFASECAGASAHGGLLVVEGSASSRCGISMKGRGYRCRRGCRAHVGLHGPGGKSGDLWQCRRQLRRFLV